MNLISVELEENNRACLSWELADTPLEPGLNEVIIRDFESCESLLTEYLDVAKPDNCNVIIGQFEWELRSSARATTAVTGRTQILEKELERLKGELSKICDQQKEFTEAPSASFDADLEALDTSSDDSRERWKAHHEEKIRLEKLRSQKYNEVRSARERLAALRKQDSSPGALRDPMVSRAIKISCYNTMTIQQNATFRLKTRWENVNRSLGFILTFPTERLEEDCRLTEILEITQNTEIDWENYRILGLGFDMTGTSRRRIPSLHYGKQEDLRSDLFRTFNLYGPKHCEWSIYLRYSRSCPQFHFATHTCKIYAAGKFVGEFKAFPVRHGDECPDDAFFWVNGVMIDDTVTVRDMCDGSRELTLRETEGGSSDITILGLRENQRFTQVRLEPAVGYKIPSTPQNPIWSPLH